MRQLDEANQAWQQYQQNQLNLLRDRLQITDSDNSSFEDIVQQIENRLNQLHEQLVIQQQTIIHPSKDTQTEEDIVREVDQVPITTADVNREQEEELSRVRENLTILTAQCARLDEANRAWQQYHQNELDNFREKLRKDLPMDDSLSLDDAAHSIVAHLDQVKNEQNRLRQQLQTSEQLNQELHSSKRIFHLYIRQTFHLFVCLLCRSIG